MEPRLIGLHRRHRHLVVTGPQKWNVTGLSTIAPLRSAKELISDRGIPEAAKRLLEQSVGQLVLADPQFVDQSPASVVGQRSV